jgi:hypothetical protein
MEEENGAIRGLSMIAQMEQLSERRNQLDQERRRLLDAQRSSGRYDETVIREATAAVDTCQQELEFLIGQVKRAIASNDAQ